MAQKKDRTFVDEVHFDIVSVMPALEDNLMREIFETKNQESRDKGHESLRETDKKLAQILAKTIEELPHVNIEWNIRHVKESRASYTSKESATGAIVPARPIVTGFAHSVPGLGNVMRGIKHLQIQYSYDWSTVPLPTKKKLQLDAATQVSLTFPTGVKSSTMLSAVRLFNGPTLSAIRYAPDEHSHAYITSNGISSKLDSTRFNVNPNVAIRIICPNYHGSAANEIPLGFLKKTIRDYAQIMGPEGCDVSFDAGKWNTATDIAQGILLQQQSLGMIDCRDIFPRINPNLDSVMRVSDFRFAGHIAQASGFYVGTTNEEPVNYSHDMQNLREPLDAMVLAHDLINPSLGKQQLGFDFREAVLEGRIRALQEFYKINGYDNRYLKNKTLIKGEFPDCSYSFRDSDNKISTLVNEGVMDLRDKRTTQAIQKLHQAQESLEQAIDAETRKPGENGNRRKDYEQIIELRQDLSVVYANLHKAHHIAAEEYYQYLDLESLLSQDNWNTQINDLLVPEEFDVFADELRHAKHYLDLALDHNPFNSNLLYYAGKFHQRFGSLVTAINDIYVGENTAWERANLETRTLLENKMGAQRRARIYFKLALDQIETQDTTCESDEVIKISIIKDYLSALEAIVPHHPNLAQEQADIRQKWVDLNVEDYLRLKDYANQFNRNYKQLRTGIQNIPVDHEARSRMIKRICNILLDYDQDISDRALLVWATTEFNEYELTELIGEGAYGVVFKGKSKIHGTEYAIKVVDPIPRTSQHIANAGIALRTYGINEFRNALVAWQIDDLKPYLVTHFFSEEDMLSHRLAIFQDIQDGTFADLQKDWTDDNREDNATHFAHELAQALQAIHKHGMNHGDLSPGNIFYKNNGQPTYQIGDFGLSHVIGQDNPLNMSKAAILVRDTQNEFKDMVDLYSWGCNVIYAYTGIQPFQPEMVKPSEFEQEINQLLGKSGQSPRQLYEIEVEKLKIDAQHIFDITHQEQIPENMRTILYDVMNPNIFNRKIRDANTLVERIEEFYQT